MPAEILPDIYDITCREDPDGKRYRVFLFDGNTPTLFDTGYADTAQTVFAGIEETGVTPERLIITHADADHAGAFDEVVDHYDLTSWVPEQADLDANAAPDHWYGDGELIGRFTAVHVPGHEPENHVLIDETARVAVMGDAVSGADQRGLPKGSSTFHPQCIPRISTSPRKASNACSSTTLTPLSCSMAPQSSRTPTRNSTRT